MIENRAVSSDKIVPLYTEYNWVKLQTTSGADLKEIEPKRGGMLIAFAPDLTRLGDFDIKKAEVEQSIEAITKAVDTVNTKYGSKDLAWKEADATPEGGKIIVLAFVDDKDASTKTLKNFNDRVIAFKDHEKIDAIKIVGKDGPLAEKHKITMFPTFVFIDPAQKDDKQVLDKKTGEMSVRAIKTALDRCQALAEKAAKAAEKR